MSTKTLNNFVQQIESTDPISLINNQEFDDILLKFGSFISILKNKKINQTMLLIEILENQVVQKCFKQLTDIDNLQTLTYNMFIRYPILCKSKIVRNKIKDLKYARNRKRKKYL